MSKKHYMKPEMEAAVFSNSDNMMYPVSGNYNIENLKNIKGVNKVTLHN